MGLSKATFAVVLHRAMARFARRSTSRREGVRTSPSNLHDELERLGNRPVPVLDDARIEALEQRLLDEFVSRPRPRLSRSWLLPAAGAARCSWAEEAQRPRSPRRSSSPRKRRPRTKSGGDRRRGHVPGRRQPNGAGRDHVPSGPHPDRSRRRRHHRGDDGRRGSRDPSRRGEHHALLAPPAPPPAPVVQDAEPPAEPVATAPPTAPAAAPMTLVPTIATPAPPAPAAVNPPRCSGQ